MPPVLTPALLSAPRLSPHEIAAALDVNIYSVYRWIHSGVCGRRLPAHRVGGRLRVLKADLDSFLAALQQDGGSA